MEWILQRCESLYYTAILVNTNKRVVRASSVDSFELRALFAFHPTIHNLVVRYSELLTHSCSDNSQEGRQIQFLPIASSQTAHSRRRCER